MYARFPLRLGSQFFHPIAGGIVFCLFYATIIPDAGWLLMDALLPGGLATARTYFQDRYRYR